MTETYAGMLARTLPELGGREINSLVAENTGQAFSDGASIAARIIAIRAEDARAIASVKLAIDAFNEWRSRPVAYSQCASYWAALS
jgi:hypothetical protein